MCSDFDPCWPPFPGWDRRSSTRVILAVVNEAPRSDLNSQKAKLPVPKVKGVGSEFGDTIDVQYVRPHSGRATDAGSQFYVVTTEETGEKLEFYRRASCELPPEMKWILQGEDKHAGRWLLFGTIFS